MGNVAKHFIHRTDTLPTLNTQKSDPRNDFLVTAVSAGAVSSTGNNVAASRTLQKLMGDADVGNKAVCMVLKNVLHQN